MKDSKYCPTCGSRNEDFNDSVSINKIKEDIEQSNYYEIKSKREIEFLIRNTPEEDSGTKGKTCIKCGTKNGLDSTFCIECGSPLIDPEAYVGMQNICPNCGNIAQEGDLFCSECGTKL